MMTYSLDEVLEIVRQHSWHQAEKAAESLCYDKCSMSSTSSNPDVTDEQLINPEFFCIEFDFCVE